MERHTAIYCRVSSRSQDTRAQEPDLKRCAAAQEGPVVWYADKMTGKTMDRPSWNELERAMKAGRVSQVCVWRLDRLGRTASGLTALFDRMSGWGVNLVSLKDGIDLSTPAGRLMANVLASVAAYENEIRGQAIRAGQEAARSAGKRWGGSKPGVRKKVKAKDERTILKMHRDGVPVATIAKATELSRQTVYNVLNATKEPATA